MINQQSSIKLLSPQIQSNYTTKNPSPSNKQRTPVRLNKIQRAHTSSNSPVCKDNYSVQIQQQNLLEFRSSVKTALSEIGDPFDKSKIAQGLRSLKNTKERLSLVKRLLVIRKHNENLEFENKIQNMKPLLSRIQKKFAQCISVAKEDEGLFQRYALSPGKKPKRKGSLYQQILTLSSGKQPLISEHNLMGKKEDNPFTLWNNHHEQEKSQILQTLAESDNLNSEMNTPQNRKMKTPQKFQTSQLFFLRSDIDQQMRSRQKTEKPQTLVLKVGRRDTIILPQKPLVRRSTIILQQKKTQIYQKNDDEQVGKTLIQLRSEVEDRIQRRMSMMCLEELTPTTKIKTNISFKGRNLHKLHSSQVIQHVDNDLNTIYQETRQFHHKQE